MGDKGERGKETEDPHFCSKMVVSINEIYTLEIYVWEGNKN